jgi:hypothetical protein
MLLRYCLPLPLMTRRRPLESYCSTSFPSREKDAFVVNAHCHTWSGVGFVGKIGWDLPPCEAPPDSASQGSHQFSTSIGHASTRFPTSYSVSGHTACCTLPPPGHMSVRIQFDQPSSRCYTNLDLVTGRVTLILTNDATISAINVKLEAESRTRLAGPKDPRNERSEKKRLELEVHKVRDPIRWEHMAAG